jgi:hypothetical protein
MNRFAISAKPVFARNDPPTTLFWRSSLEAQQHCQPPFELAVEMTS